MKSILFLVTLIASGPEGSVPSLRLEPDTADRRALSIPEQVPFPEGVAARRNGDLFVGSLTTGAIARLSPRNGRAEVWLSGGILERGAIGLTVDRRRRVLWVCDASTFEPVASALVGIDLRTRAVVARHALPTDGHPVLCNDVSVRPGGDIFMTDSFGGRILRVLRKDALRDTPAEEWSVSPLLAAPNEPPFGANGIVATRRAIFTVNFNTGTLIRIPVRRRGRAGVAKAISLFDRDGHPTRIMGPDGLTVSGFGELLVVENGVFGGPNRLTRIELEFKRGDFRGYLYPLATGLNIPTTVAIAGDVAWVVEGQLDHFLGLDPSPPDPFQLVGVELHDR